VTKALELAGKSVDEAQKALVESTIAALSAEDASERSAARRLLASWLFPKSRTVDLDLFRGTRTAEERLSRVVAAMGLGGMTPEEAATASKVVAALAEAGEWEEVRQLHERAVRGEKEPPALPVGPADGMRNEPSNAATSAACAANDAARVTGKVISDE
jgi:hypothetical protein